MVMIREKGVPGHWRKITPAVTTLVSTFLQRRCSPPEMRGGAMGREHRERKAVKERCRSGTQSAYFFPNISCCSSGLPSRSALGVLYSRGTSS